MPTFLFVIFYHISINYFFINSQKLVNGIPYIKIHYINTKRDYKTGQLNQLNLFTNSSQFQDLSFTLQKRASLHSGHLKSSITDRLYEGYLLKNDKIDRSSPARFKVWSPKFKSNLEVSGLFYLNLKVFSLRTFNDGSVVIMLSKNATKSDKFHKCVAKDKRELKLNLQSKTERRLNSSQLKKENLIRIKRNVPQRSFVEIIIFNSAEYYAKYGSSKQTVWISKAFGKNFPPITKENMLISLKHSIYWLNCLFNVYEDQNERILWFQSPSEAYGIDKSSLLFFMHSILIRPLL